MAQQTQWATASTLEGLYGHNQTPQIRWEFSRRVVSPTQKILPDYKQQSQEIDNHNLDGILSKTPIKRETAEAHFRSRGHWERLYNFITLVQQYIQ
jgi:hypothetical protein